MEVVLVAVVRRRDGVVAVVRRRDGGTKVGDLIPPSAD